MTGHDYVSNEVVALARKVIQRLSQFLAELWIVEMTNGRVQVMTFFRLRERVLPFLGFPLVWNQMGMRLFIGKSSFQILNLKETLGWDAAGQTRRHKIRCPRRVPVGQVPASESLL